MDRERKQLDALLTRAAAINTEIDGLAELPELDEAQITRWDELVVEGEALAADEPALRARIDSLDAIRALRDKPGVTIDEGVKTVHQIVRTDNPYDIDEVRINVGATGTTELRGRALKAVEGESSYDLADTGKQHLSRLLERNDDRNGTIAKLVLATGSDAYRSAFAKAVAGAVYQCNDVERAALARAASLTTTAGGFAVPFPIDPTLILTNDGAANPWRAISNVKTITTDSWQGISAGAVNASWDGQAAEVSDDTPTWAQPAVPVYKAQAFVPYSIEIGEDYPGFAADLFAAINEGKDELESAAFATGSGSSQPTGVITSLVASANNVPTSITADTYAVDDVFKTKQALPPKYRSNATWAMNLNIMDLTRAFGSALGYKFLVDMTSGNPPELLGRPVVESSAMDGAIGAGADNYVVVVGDFSNFVIADRVGLSVESIQHLFHTTSNRPSGSRGLYAYWRTGSDVTNSSAFSLLNVT